MSSLRSFGDDYSKEKALGLVKLIRRDGVILIPRPSSHPDDPLNWSRGYKYYITLLLCFGTLLSTFLVAGPLIAIEDIAVDLGGNPNASLLIIVPRVVIFFTATALAQGTGNLLWQPFSKKYGRRFIYIISSSGYFLAALWSGLAQDYSTELAARIFLGFFAGAVQGLGPLTICDLFFHHERAAAMSLFSSSIAAGRPIGLILSGIITLDHNSWRNIYFIGTLLIGFWVLMIIFTFPETAYNRIHPENESQRIGNLTPSSTFNSTADEEKGERKTFAETPTSEDISIPYQPPKKDYFETLNLFTGETYTKDPFFLILIRPIFLFLHPSILWATLIQTILLTSAISISTTLPNDFATTYNFSTVKSLLCFLAGVLGALIAIPVGGSMGQYIVKFLTLRNNGVMVPEFRLPALGISMITAPLGLMLYGIALKFEFSVAVAVLGLSLIWFSVGQAFNVSLIYAIDVYSPFVAEVVAAQLAFKAIISFVLMTFIDDHMDPSKRLILVSSLAGASALILSLAFPMFIWGMRIRRASLDWRITHKLVRY